MNKILLIISLAALLISCDKTEKTTPRTYDCVDNYEGWKIVEIPNDVLEKGKFIIKKGCEYKELYVPNYYHTSYSIGDTLGKRTTEQIRDDYYKLLVR